MPRGFGFRWVTRGFLKRVDMRRPHSDHHRERFPEKAARSRFCSHWLDAEQDRQGRASVARSPMPARSAAIERAVRRDR
jgi:hypothetical protein